MQYQMTAQLGVKSAFELTWQTLDAATAEVAMLLSLFAADVIPWYLVEWMMQRVHDEEYAVSDARRELENSYLIQPVDSEEADDPGGCKLHPLIREFLQAKLAEFEASEPLQRAFMDVLIGAAKQMPQAPTVDVIADFAIVRPHLEEVVVGMIDCVSDDDLAWAFIGLARFYEGQGLYTLAEPWYQDCLTATQTRLRQEHPAVAASLNNLAALYKSQGRYSEAEPLLVQALELSHRLFGQEHPAMAVSLNNLAMLYKIQGRYSEAEPLYVQALELSHRLLGQEHPNVATSLNNLAGLYESQGRCSEAEPLYVQALELSHRLVRQEHPDVASNLNNLAMLYYSQGRYSEAEPLYVQALEMSKRLLGEEHPDVASSLNNLAGLYESQGRYSEAEPLYVQALSICGQKLGDDHPTTCTIRQNLEHLNQQMCPDRSSSLQKRRSHPVTQFLRAIIRFLKRLFRR
ncbi:MAG TPA: tetratricopeptide repeat protein [Coleofasciculaceae cyanobacterium]